MATEVPVKSVLNIPNSDYFAPFVTMMTVRLASIITHFKPLHRDPRICGALEKEFGVLRAYIGHWRMTVGRTELSESSMPGSFLAQLQKALETGDQEHFSHLAELASDVVVSTGSRCRSLPDPPFERWWTHLPANPKDIPTKWQPFDLGTRIIQAATAAMNTQDAWEDWHQFIGQVRMLDGALGSLEDSLMARMRRIETDWHRNAVVLADSTSVHLRPSTHGEGELNREEGTQEAGRQEARRND